MPWASESMLGVDISAHQLPHEVQYSEIPDFAIVRFAYGTAIDKHAQAHVANVRAAGKRLGGYTFFRPSIEWRPQFDTLLATCDRFGLTSGDLLPVIDVERDPYPDDPDRKFAAAYYWWPLEDYAHAVADLFGGAILYGNIARDKSDRNCVRLTDPDQFRNGWTKQFPVWASQYGVSEPEIPFGFDAIGWQFDTRPKKNHPLKRVLPNRDGLDCNYFRRWPTIR